MRNGSRHFPIFILLITALCSFAQEAPRFIQISGTGQFRIGKINAMTRDRHGMVWLSDQTNQCIIRYDGEHMTRFTQDVRDSNSLGGTYPECFYADAAGFLWIGFFGQGLDRYDPNSKKFTHFRHHRQDDEGLSNDSVSAILIDHLGNLWVGTMDGLDLIDQHSGKIKHFRKKTDDQTSLSSNRVRALYEDREGTLWIGTGFPWDEDRQDGGLNRFERSTERFNRFVNDPSNPNSLASNKVRAIFEDRQGNFWVGTGGDGLHTLDRKTGLLQRHPYDPKRPHQLSRPAMKGVDDHITFFTEDYYGNIWIGTYANGLSRYDPKTKEITHFGNGRDADEYFMDNSGWCANSSVDGVFFISTQAANLFRVDLFTHELPSTNVAGGINSFFQDQPGMLWMCSDGGLIRKNLLTNKSQIFVHDPKKKNSLSFSAASVVVKANDSSYFIGTWGGGLNLFHPATESFTQEYVGSGKDLNLNYTVIPRIYQDKDSNLWISTWQHGFNLKNLKTGKVTHFEANPADSNSLSHNMVVGFLEANPNEMWIGTHGGGMNKMNWRTGKFKHYLLNEPINCLFKDSQGTYWAGSENGLYRYDKEADNFLSISRVSEYFQINAVRSLIDDKDGNLWVGGLEGIFKINLKKMVSILYASSSGVHGDLLSFDGAHRSPEGKLFFGGGNGYYSFFPNQLTVNPAEPNISINDFWLNGKVVVPGPGSVLDTNPDETKEIELSYDQNTFSFGFNSMYYGDNSDKFVYYKLENYDKDWIPGGPENRANFFSLPPGKYVFKTKVLSKNNGIQKEKSIQVIVLSPWWKRWWAYIIYAFVLLIILVLFDRVQRRRIIDRERERSKDKELAQAREIEKAYQELKITQGQLVQQEKMASLGELTAGIAHEIQNPLNFVNNFSDVNTELIDETMQAMDKGNSTEAKKLLAGIRDNEEKIKFHGQRADSIVKGMLQHARTSTGQKESTDLNALAEEYLRLSYQGFRTRNKSFHAKLITHFDSEVGKVEMVSQDMGRVLLNLYNNAFYAVAPLNVKAGTTANGNDNEPTIWVKTKRIHSVQSGQPDTISFSIRDNGPGVSLKVIDKIFQPFFTTKPTGQGTGLGLSLSYDIVKAHGGEIKVVNHESGGAEFTILIPDYKD
jgi:ligand-binding sensor domain-containing protein/signal transduction histidine kinase